MELGEPMKDEFLLDKSIAFVNHGSYGPCPKRMLEQRIKFMYEQENQPDLWFRFNLEKYYDEALTAGAEFVGAKKENFALVENVTTGINTIVKSLTLQPGDRVMIHSHAYNAVKNIIKEQEEFKGVEVVTVEIPIPIKSEDEFVDLFRRCFTENPGIKLAVFDHITSPSAIVFPVKRLVGLAREFGAMSLIDGAHAPGQLELNLEELGADFYSANFHKWCYVPRSCGFIWFASKYHGQIRPLVTSHGYKQSLDAQFILPGTRDTTSQLCLPHALKFYKEIGGLKAIQAHAKEMLSFASKIMVDALGTEELDIPDSMRAPYMMAVRLPITDLAKIGQRYGSQTFDRLAMCRMMLQFHHKYNAQPDFCDFNGKLWLRCSVNVYNYFVDYVRVKDSVVTELGLLEGRYCG